MLEGSKASRVVYQDTGGGAASSPAASGGVAGLAPCGKPALLEQHTTLWWLWGLVPQEGRLTCSQPQNDLTCRTDIYCQPPYGEFHPEVLNIAVSAVAMSLPYQHFIPAVFVVAQLCCALLPPLGAELHQAGPALAGNELTEQPSPAHIVCEYPAVTLVSWSCHCGFLRQGRPKGDAGPRPR